MIRAHALTRGIWGAKELWRQRPRHGFGSTRNGEKEERRPCVMSWSEQGRSFTPFLVSADGLIVGKEVKTYPLCWLTRKCVAMVSDARRSIATVRAKHLCLRGSRIPTSQMSNRRPYVLTSSIHIECFDTYLLLLCCILTCAPVLIPRNTFAACRDIWLVQSLQLRK
jgi:hypothetical protein